MLFICYLKEEMALKCPFCNYNDTKVIDSRGQEDNSVIRRRRLCLLETANERGSLIRLPGIRNTAAAFAKAAENASLHTSGLI